MASATIQMIEKVEHIENSDFLDKVKVLGWQVVTKRDEFKVGDLCIFVEIDTLLEDRPEYEFLKNKKFRIKTCKLRGELSQGIVFPLSLIMNAHVRTGEDISELIGATHYEKPIPISLSGLVRGNFPTYLVSKTDEERIQNCPNILEELKGKEVYSSVKCNGTSATYINFNNDFQVCTRNNSLKLENNENVYITIAKKYDIMNTLKDKNIAIQGEICGPGIQKNHLGLKELEIFIFNVWDIDEKRYYNYFEFLSFCKKIKLRIVPLIERFIFNHTMEQLLDMAKGLYLGTKNNREGIVIRPVKEMYSETLKGRLSFKVLNNEYLLENEE